MQSRSEYDILPQYTTCIKSAFIDSFICFLDSSFLFIISEKSPLKKEQYKPFWKISKMLQDDPPALKPKIY